MVKLGNDWDEILSDEFEKPYYLELREFLKEEYRTKTIYPNMNNIFEETSSKMQNPELPTKYMENLSKKMTKIFKR